MTTFFKKHQPLQNILDCDLLDVPIKWCRPIAKPLAEYRQQSTTCDEIIKNAYRSGCYIKNKIGEYFRILNSMVSLFIIKQNNQ